MLQSKIAPSASARHLYGKMVIRSDVNLAISLEDTLKLAVELVRAGESPQDSSEVAELVAEGWIDQAPDGGWLLH